MIYYCKEKGEFMHKVALVTGSAQGLGKTIIEQFANEGYDVIINYNNSEKEALELEKYINENYNVKVMSIKCDISKEEEIVKMKEEILKIFPKVDVLVNNAAIEVTSENRNSETFNETLQINLIGTFLVSKYIGEIMYKNKYGKIINISSNNSINKYDPVTLEYDASKAGVNSLTHNLAILYAPYINVNAVAPGWIKTEKIEKLNKTLDNKLEIEESKNILLNRFAKPEEIANLVLFLASDKANYINSEIIKVDGGTR